MIDPTPESRMGGGVPLPLATNWPDDARNYQSRGIFMEILRALVSGIPFLGQFLAGLIASPSLRVMGLNAKTNTATVAVAYVMSSEAHGSAAGAYIGLTGGAAQTNRVTTFQTYDEAANSYLGALALQPNGGTVAVPSGAMPPEAYTAPTLINSWTNNTLGYGVAGYLKTADGFVRLRGQIVGGAFNSTAFTLPVGYRPSATQMFACGYYTGASWTTCDVVVDIFGNVIINQAAAAGSMVALNNVEFDTR